MTPATRPSTVTPLRAATASASRAWAPWRSLCESRISSPVATTVASTSSPTAIFSLPSSSASSARSIHASPLPPTSTKTCSAVIWMTRPLTTWPISSVVWASWRANRVAKSSDSVMALTIILTPAMATPRPAHLSMIRGFHLADFLTLGNAACGTISIFAAMVYVDTRHARALWTAIALLPLGLVLDVLDGRVARWRQRHSAMGRELDSLADVISFGVAPAALAYGAGMRGAWDVVLLVYFVCCGVSRLARFNVTAEALSTDTGTVKYFEGTPIPSSLVLVAIVAGCARPRRPGAAPP